MKHIFSRLGIPEEIISDNGPQYASKSFEKFAKTWGFKHTTSSPYYPRANGLAERYVQVVKDLLEKTKQDDKDPYLAMLEHRNTPMENYKSPSELLRIHTGKKTSYLKTPIFLDMGCFLDNYIHIH